MGRRAIQKGLDEGILVHGETKARFKLTEKGKEFAAEKLKKKTNQENKISDSAVITKPKSIEKKNKKSIKKVVKKKKKVTKKKSAGKKIVNKNKILKKKKTVKKNKILKKKKKVQKKQKQK